MNLAIVATIVYGLLSGLGGIWGYIKSQSKPSLIAGCISGGLLLIGAFMQSQEYSSGLLISMVITVLLLVVFAIRLTKTKKFMPSGIMLIAGAITLSCLFA